MFAWGMLILGLNQNKHTTAYHIYQWRLIHLLIGLKDLATSDDHSKRKGIAATEAFYAFFAFGGDY